ncbi:MAG: DNA ligase-associated metallophosphoesterase [Bradymonadia bacterium]|jgi:DNA ligase-associated metallophosphoesterase
MSPWPRAESVSVAGETLTLLPQRAIYWARMKALLVADLHVGRAEALQLTGVAMPSEYGESELQRLSETLEACQAQALWVLGDLVHNADALKTDSLSRLRARHLDVAFHLVRGNHDRHVPTMPDAWGFEEWPEPTPLGPFILRHHPEASEQGYVLAGHEHPTVRVRAGGDCLILPCFHFGEALGLLPAFTSFSSGIRKEPSQGATFVIADEEVVRLS